MLLEGGAEPGPTAGLSLDEKAALTGGDDTWHTVAAPRAGIPALRFTDGPAGVRGVRFSGTVSASLPCGTALAATWNRGLVGRVGTLLGEEARRRGAHVLLAPTVNVHRHPFGGRNFESFSEDPYLSAQMADAYIRGVQGRGVGCAIKHLVANDQEQDRMEISVDVDERALREIYLPAFETAVRESGVWAVMAAYNRLHGIHCSEHEGLLSDLLRHEWGFDGLVVSDWFGTHSTLAVPAGLDLEMPGPPRFLGSHVAAAVRQGDMAERVLDRAAGHIMRLAGRVAGPGRPAADGDHPPLQAAHVARDAAVESVVLLRNQGALPLNPDRPQSIAVLGPKAERTDVQGGGSVHVDPQYVVTILDGLAARAREAEGVTVSHEVGVPARAPAPLDDHELSLPGSSEAGLLVEYFAGCSPEDPDRDLGAPVSHEVVPRSRLLWLGELAPELDPATGATVRASADVVPDRSGTWRFRLASVGASRMWLDGEVVVDNLSPVRGESFMGYGSTAVEGSVELEAGTSHRLVLELYVVARERPGLSGVEVVAVPPELSGTLERAVALAAEADVAVVAVGEDAVSSEGHDRRSLALPPEQVHLVEAVAAVNAATVVVVNTGAPVVMDGFDQVNAVIQMWYLGQEAGAALAAVLFGDVDASGRLPTTFPRRVEDVPSHRFFPGDGGRVHYGEGVLVGYRHYDTVGVEPLFCFGHGLSYTEFTYGELLLTTEARSGEGVLVVAEVELTNVGQRRGSEVVQVYVHDAAASVERPEQELKQFAKVELEPGESQKVRLELPWRAFAFWDSQAHEWAVEPGHFEVRVGSSSRALHRRASLELDASTGAVPSAAVRS